VDIIKTFPDLTGFYILTREGELGFYNEAGEMEMDAAHSKTFADYNKKFLAAYAQDTEKPDVRIGLIFHTKEDRPWGGGTFALETGTLRNLYPVTASKVDDALTTFQKKNQEQSIFRAVELLLEYKSEHSHHNMSYCPVLFDRNSRLKHYSHIECLQLNDAETPVLEVLNLAAFLPTEKRTGPAIMKLKKSIYNNAIRKDKRDSLLSVIEGRDYKSDSSAIDDPYKEERARRYDGIAIPVWEAGDIRAWMKQHWGEITGESLGPWLVKPYQFVMPDNLKSFTRFRGIDLEGLTEIAENSPIFQAPVGARLLDRDTNDNWNLYLLDGTIEMEAGDGATKQIDGRTEQSSAPISFLKPRMYAVRAITDVKFLFINDDFVSKFPVVTETEEDADRNSIDLPDFFKR
jgi:hypothetical protein